MRFLNLQMLLPLGKLGVKVLVKKWFPTMHVSSWSLGFMLIPNYFYFKICAIHPIERNEAMAMGILVVLLPLLSVIS
jgi:hypothetical protein